MGSGPPAPPPLLIRACSDSNCTDLSVTLVDVGLEVDEPFDLVGLSFGGGRKKLFLCF